MGKNKQQFAVLVSDSRGRLYGENSRADVRGCFARDRDRILHSTAFRRLKGKTQVFASTNEDHHRTRITHTLEVAQIARTIARTLLIDEDLTETIALAHDLGHTPYGHVGEDALDECMSDFGGFEHNAQSLRIVTKLEERYPTFDGLNLTWESLEGIVKHNGSLQQPYPTCITEFNNVWDLDVTTRASLEAQVAAIADDVAYNHHDIDDGWRAGMFEIDDLYQVEHIGQVLDVVKSEYSGINDNRLMAETLRRLMSAMIVDIVETTNNNLSRINPQSADDIRKCGEQIVLMTDDLFQKIKSVRDFLFKNVYRSPEINLNRDYCFKNVKTLFNAYMNDQRLLPKGWLIGITDNDKARSIADYIAGMTDRYADARGKELSSK